MPLTEHRFTPEHYRTLLQAGLDSGYAFLLFGEAAKGRSVYLRHDVDNSVDDALAMASIEADLAVRSTYLILLRSRNYNLLAGDSIAKVRQIAALGHEIGLHHSCEPGDAVDGRRPLEQSIRADAALLEAQTGLPVRVFSLHNPAEKDNFALEIPGLINTYHSRYFREIKYLSESNFRWRDGCPCNLFLSQRYDVMQILVHPMSYAASLDSDREALLHFLTQKVRELSQINQDQNRVLRGDRVSIGEVADHLKVRG